MDASGLKIFNVILDDLGACQGCCQVIMIIYDNIIYDNHVWVSESLLLTGGWIDHRFCCLWHPWHVKKNRSTLIFWDVSVMTRKEFQDQLQQLSFLYLFLHNNT